MFLSQLLEVTSHPWHFLADSRITPLSSSVVTLPSSLSVTFCFHLAFSSECGCVPKFPSSFKNTGHIGLGPTLMTSTEPDHIAKTFFPN